MTEGAVRTSRLARESHRDLNETISLRYTLLTEIARGERSVVHMARPHGASGAARPVVLKCLKPEFALRSECVEVARHETWVSSQLHHAHLTRCLEVLETEDSFCVVQNYVEGDNLANLLHAADRTSQERYVLPILVDVLEGLHAVHTALDDQGWPLLLLHGAVRARHVLVGVDGTARLTDFSETRSVRGLVSHPANAPRTQARNMAPEQALDPGSADHRSDLFLAGVMLWEALTGTTLFAAETEELTLQHLMRRPFLPPSKAGLRPSPCLDEICLRALAREPDKRYDTALDMARALRDAGMTAGIYASQAEIGEWVQSRAASKLAEQQLAASDTQAMEEPTGRYYPRPASTSEIHPIIGKPQRVPSVDAEWDDEPTARFTRSPLSDMRELAGPSNSTNSEAEVRRRSTQSAPRPLRVRVS